MCQTTIVMHLKMRAFLDAQTASSQTNCPAFDWTQIVEQFQSAFQVIFGNDRKAHFDNLPDEYGVVDGAKFHWCKLLLLDAMVFALTKDTLNLNARRAFNQHVTLYECILRHLKVIDPQSYTTITLRKASDVAPETVGSRSLCDKYSVDKIKVSMDNRVWHSMQTLENLLIFDCPASKAKNKFPIVVKLLTQHEAFAPYSYNPQAIVAAVIHKVLFVLNTKRPTEKLRGQPRVTIEGTLRELRQSHPNSERTLPVVSGGGGTALTAGLLPTKKRSREYPTSSFSSSSGLLTDDMLGCKDETQEKSHQQLSSTIKATLPLSAEETANSVPNANFVRSSTASSSNSNICNLCNLTVDPALTSLDQVEPAPSQSGAHMPKRAVEELLGDFNLEFDLSQDAFHGWQMINDDGKPSSILSQQRQLLVDCSRAGTGTAIGYNSTSAVHNSRSSSEDSTQLLRDILLFDGSSSSSSGESSSGGESGVSERKVAVVKEMTVFPPTSVATSQAVTTTVQMSAVNTSHSTGNSSGRSRCHSSSSAIQQTGVVKNDSDGSDGEDDHTGIKNDHSESGNEDTHGIAVVGSCQQPPDVISALFHELYPKVFGLN